jgi:hypothetical protein
MSAFVSEPSHINFKRRVGLAHIFNSLMLSAWSPLKCRNFECG